MDRIKKRQRPELSSILNYLQKPRDDYDQLTDFKDLFSFSKNNLMRKEIIKIIKRVQIREIIKLMKKAKKQKMNLLHPFK